MSVKIPAIAKARLTWLGVAILVLLSNLFLAIRPVTAHHPLAGRLPANAFEGFLSGLAHPVIGLNHFAFVVAVGLLAASQRRGFLIPAAFVLTALGGTGIHLMNVDLPAPEQVISASVLLFGILLAAKTRPNVLVITGLGAIAGLFHGYAYGEAIVGAGMAPLVAYLAGFTFIQLTVAMLAFAGGRLAVRRVIQQPIAPLQVAGLVISTLGIVFLGTILLSAA
jgi:urease accessory protein